MPITYSDRISGTIYAIAQTAERAGDLAMDYLRNKNGEPAPRGVFDRQEDADRELYNRNGSHDTDGDRVYAISLDIRVADEK
ncbi:hypothetical protein [Streptomyces sp. bgisy082]|uniref:hypothetical protein n=1 Tax=Streptomyces sp. bgisy082 TaxID=3413776 RepID=UPI003D7418E8